LPKKLVQSCTILSLHLLAHAAYLFASFSVLFERSLTLSCRSLIYAKSA
jgi:hypothetical protein